MKKNKIIDYFKIKKKIDNINKNISRINFFYKK